MEEKGTEDNRSSTTSSSSHSQRERRSSSSAATENARKRENEPRLPSKDGKKGFQRNMVSRGRGKWFVESSVGRAVKLGIQRMKIKSIGSDPNKHKGDQNIKSKLLADDVPQAPASRARSQSGPARAPVVEAEPSGGGFNFNAFAALVQSNSNPQIGGSVPPPVQAAPVSLPAELQNSGCGLFQNILGGGSGDDVAKGQVPSADSGQQGGNIVFGQLMSAMGNANLGQMPALPANAIREEEAFMPTPHGADNSRQEVAPSEPPPQIMSFMSLFSVKPAANSDEEDTSESEAEVDEEPSRHHGAPLPTNGQGAAPHPKRVVEWRQPAKVHQPGPPAPQPSPNLMGPLSHGAPTGESIRANARHLKTMVETLSIYLDEHEKVGSRIDRIKSAMPLVDPTNHAGALSDLTEEKRVVAVMCTRLSDKVRKLETLAAQLESSAPQPPPPKAEENGQRVEDSLPEDLEEELLFSNPF